MSGDELMALFEPFVLPGPGGSEAAWKREVARRKRKLLKKGGRRLLLGWLPRTQRRSATVLAEYDKAWSEIDYGIYGIGAPQRDYTPWQWRGRRMFASDVGATRFRQLLLIRFLERLRPRRVLEVGCGNGVNLMLLACRFPEIAFSGVELTKAGHHAARGLQQQSELPPAMRDYAPLPLADPSAFRRIEFHQGNATALPFADRAFDLVITVLALEQMERVRAAALAEVARVAAQQTLMIEPFADVNDRFWLWLNVECRDYFRGRIADLPRYGLEPRLTIDDYPQESFLRTCAVLADKGAGAGGVESGRS